MTTRGAPWYLLTNEPVDARDDAWRIAFIYPRRRQTQVTDRYSKTELALESPRPWNRERRLELVVMAILAYAVLLPPLDWACQGLGEWLYRHWCHQAEKRYRQFAIPLYRRRSALSRLWLAYPPSPLFLFQSPG